MKECAKMILALFRVIALMYPSVPSTSRLAGEEGMRSIFDCLHFEDVISLLLLSSKVDHFHCPEEAAPGEAALGVNVPLVGAADCVHPLR